MSDSQAPIQLQPCDEHDELVSVHSDDTASTNETSPSEAPLTTWRCTTSVLALAGPSMLAFLLEFVFMSVSVAFVGRWLGAEALAATSVAITSFNVAASSIGIGLGQALDTLCSQEYGRDNKSTRLGIFLQQGFFIQGCVVLYSAVLFHYSYDILRLLFSETLARGASEYLSHSTPTLVVMLFMICTSRFLTAQCITSFTMYSVMVAACLCPVYNYYLIGYGIKGAAWALGASYGTQLVVMWTLCYRCEQVRTTWGGLRLREAITVPGLRAFMALGVPSLMSTTAEWWAFESNIIIATCISDLSVAVWSVQIGVLMIMFAPIAGLSTGIIARVGNSLGDGKPHNAKKYAAASIGVGVGIASVNATLLVVLSSSIYGLYTTDERIMNTLADQVYLAAVMHVLDAFQFSVQAVFRACGKQLIAATCSLFNLWCVGVVTAYVLAIVLEFGVKGLLGGLIAGSLCMGPVLVTIMILRFDWQELSDTARSRHAAEVRCDAPVVTTSCIADDSSSTPRTECVELRVVDASEAALSESTAIIVAEATS